jgi:hypothetical protein
MLTDQQLEIDEADKAKWLQQRSRFIWLSVLSCALFSAIFIYKFCSNNSATSTISAKSQITKVAEPKSQTADESALDHFTFFNNGDPNELREWVNTAPGTWEERYPNGHRDVFKVLRHSSEKGFGANPDLLRPGTIVRKASGDVEVFIPDHGVKDAMAAIRAVPDGLWRDIRPIDREDAEQIPTQ